MQMICGGKGKSIYRLSWSISYSYSTNSCTNLKGCDPYTECMEIEICTGIISRQGHNWNRCLTPLSAAMAMWMSNCEIQTESSGDSGGFWQQVGRKKVLY